MDKTSHIDIQFLVEEVKKKPVLWDMENDLYKDRFARKNAWSEICRNVYKDFDKKCTAEKNGLCFTLSNKWKNLRDNYRKSQRYSSVIKGRRQYVHGKLLNFINEDKINTDHEIEPADSPNNSEDVEEMLTLGDDEIDIKTEELSGDEDSLSHVGPSVSEPSAADDDDLAFFMSTMPMVKKLKMKQKLAFRIDVMNSLRKHCDLDSEEFE
ncbi:hypothetical protein JYU34_003701 [Plutella xylostella]|uniref:MADF domain-containing protein n=1 Tax=Plutella xylostella TaxID=51655 RepID=A0ABQ7R0Q7_PLUXY|nr:hypothetical protein JYU34_003701 [Plutella xylostella]